MSILNSLSLAIDLATRNRDQAVVQLQHMQRTHHASQDQMAQLEGYASETESKWITAAQVGSSPELMGNHYQFMDRLHHAMGLQTTVVASHDPRISAAQQALLATELRLSSLKKLTEKRRKEFELLQTRREQKQTDERAALQYRTLSNGPDGRES